MRAVILSAGQGRRLLPFTRDLPKCLLAVQGTTILERQIDALAKHGLTDVAVVVGYGAERVEERLAHRYGKNVIRTVYNPFYAHADNLVSCWAARSEMQDDFILLNGDTLFEAAVAERLLQAPDGPITLATDRKSDYDADDMKVIVQDKQLRRVGKKLPLDKVNGESIGMSMFRGDGPRLFRDTIEQALRTPEGLRQWYLSSVDTLAQADQVRTQPIEGLRWAEVDDANDLRHAETLFMAESSATSKRAVAEARKVSSVS